MTDKQTNPLLCDTGKALCVAPGNSVGTVVSTASQNTKLVRIIYFTDPICSACWSIEPQLRKLQLEYGAHIEITYHMGGLLPSWEVYNSGGISKPSDVAHHWEEMSAYAEMPIDGDVWLEDPLNSSYPPSIAFKAAELQDRVKAIKFLRRAREMVFLEKKNITKWEHIKQAAIESGLDTAQLLTDYNGKAQQLFQEDLIMAKQYRVRGFPALYFSDSLNNQSTLYGFKPYEDFERIIQKISPAISKKIIDTEGENLFNYYPTLTAKEFSVLGNLSKEAANNMLLELTNKGIIEKHQSKNGAIWKKKNANR